MRNVANKIEDMLIEVAFAEERRIENLKSISGRFTDWFDRLFTAITFAEAGEFDAARVYTGGGSGDNGNPVGYCLLGFCAGRA